jgi:acetyltransferase-like isoleucine patch superfamily enzyme
LKSEEQHTPADLSGVTNTPHGAVIHGSAKIGHNTVVWNWTQVRENAVVGDNTTIGQGVYIGPGVTVGADCKIQNGAKLYEPAVLANGVFIGPNVVLTNDRLPRSLQLVSYKAKGEGDWDKVGVTIGKGASLGANVVCVAPLTVGEWAFVGAGSVVSSDVKPYALLVGNPARQIGWVGRGGAKLVPESGRLVCPETGEIFALSEDGFLKPV